MKDKIFTWYIGKPEAKDVVAEQYLDGTVIIDGKGDFDLNIFDGVIKRNISYNATKIIFAKDNKLKPTDLTKMFSEFTNLEYIDFTNLDVSKVVSIKNIFIDCENLKEINMSNLRFDLLDNDLALLVSDCKNLIKFNISGTTFNESLGFGTIGLIKFDKCKKLKELNISNIDKYMVNELINVRSLTNQTKFICTLSLGDFIDKYITYPLV